MNTNAQQSSKPERDGEARQALPRSKDSPSPFQVSHESEEALAEKNYLDLFYYEPHIYAVRKDYSLERLSYEKLGCKEYQLRRFNQARPSPKTRMLALTVEHGISYSFPSLTIVSYNIGTFDENTARAPEVGRPMSHVRFISACVRKAMGKASDPHVFSWSNVPGGTSLNPSTIMLEDDVQRPTILHQYSDESVMIIEFFKWVRSLSTSSQVLLIGFGSSAKLVAGKIVLNQEEVDKTEDLPESCEDGGRYLSCGYDLPFLINKIHAEASGIVFHSTAPMVPLKSGEHGLQGISKLGILGHNVHCVDAEQWLLNNLGEGEACPEGRELGSWLELSGLSRIDEAGLTPRAMRELMNRPSCHLSTGQTLESVVSLHLRRSDLLLELLRVKKYVENLLVAQDIFNAPLSQVLYYPRSNLVAQLVLRRMKKYRKNISYINTEGELDDGWEEFFMEQANKAGTTEPLQRDTSGGLLTPLRPPGIAPNKAEMIRTRRLSVTKPIPENGAWVDSIALLFNLSRLVPEIMRGCYISPSSYKGSVDTLPAEGLPHGTIAVANPKEDPDTYNPLDPSYMIFKIPTNDPYHELLRNLYQELGFEARNYAMPSDKYAYSPVARSIRKAILLTIPRLLEFPSSPMYVPYCTTAIDIMKRRALKAIITTLKSYGYVPFCDEELGCLILSETHRKNLPPPLSPSFAEEVSKIKAKILQSIQQNLPRPLRPERVLLEWGPVLTRGIFMDSRTQFGLEAGLPKQDSLKLFCRGLRFFGRSKHVVMETMNLLRDILESSDSSNLKLISDFLNKERRRLSDPSNWMDYAKVQKLRSSDPVAVSVLLRHPELADEEEVAVLPVANGYRDARRWEPVENILSSRLPLDVNEALSTCYRSNFSSFSRREAEILLGNYADMDGLRLRVETPANRAETNISQISISFDQIGLYLPSRHCSVYEILPSNLTLQKLFFVITETKNPPPSEKFDHCSFIREVRRYVKVKASYDIYVAEEAGNISHRIIFQLAVSPVLNRIIAEGLNPSFPALDIEAYRSYRYLRCVDSPECTGGELKPNIFHKNSLRNYLETLIQYTEGIPVFEPSPLYSTTPFLDIANPIPMMEALPPSIKIWLDGHYTCGYRVIPEAAESTSLIIMAKIIPYRCPVCRRDHRGAVDGQVLHMNGRVFSLTCPQSVTRETITFQLPNRSAERNSRIKTLQRCVDLAAESFKEQKMQLEATNIRPLRLDRKLTLLETNSPQYTYLRKHWAKDIPLYDRMLVLRETPLDMFSGKDYYLLQQDLRVGYSVKDTRPPVHRAFCTFNDFCCTNDAAKKGWSLLVVENSTRLRPFPRWLRSVIAETERVVLVEDSLTKRVAEELITIVNGANDIGARENKMHRVYSSIIPIGAWGTKCPNDKYVKYDILTPITFVRSGPGTGKMHQLKKILQRDAAEKKPRLSRVCVITSRNSTELEGFETFSRHSGKAKISILEHPRVIIPMEGIKNLSPQSFSRIDLLVLDEVESMFNRLNVANSGPLQHVFCHLIEGSKKILAFDERLSDKSMEMIRHMRPNEEHYLVKYTSPICNASAEVREVSAQVPEEVGFFFEKVDAARGRGVKIWSMITSPRLANKLAEHRIIRGDTVLRFCGTYLEAVQVIEGKTVTHSHSDCSVDNLGEYVEKYQPDILISTSILSSGTSISSEWFNSFYHWYSANVNPIEFLHSMNLVKTMIPLRNKRRRGLICIEDKIRFNPLSMLDLLQLEDLDDLHLNHGFVDSSPEQFRLYLTARASELRTRATEYLLDGLTRRGLRLRLLPRSLNPSSLEITLFEPVRARDVFAHKLTAEEVEACSRLPLPEGGLEVASKKTSILRLLDCSLEEVNALSEEQVKMAMNERTRREYKKMKRENPEEYNRLPFNTRVARLCIYHPDRRTLAAQSLPTSLRVPPATAQDEPVAPKKITPLKTAIEVGKNLVMERARARILDLVGHLSIPRGSDKYKIIEEIARSPEILSSLPSAKTNHAGIHQIISMILGEDPLLVIDTITRPVSMYLVYREEHPLPNTYKGEDGEPLMSHREYLKECICSGLGENRYLIEKSGFFEIKRGSEPVNAKAPSMDSPPSCEEVPAAISNSAASGLLPEPGQSLPKRGRGRPRKS